MFTGIVTDIGKIVELEKRGDLRARIETNYDMSTVAILSLIHISEPTRPY